MRLITVKSKGLAHSSYYLSDGKDALVVDPRRDCQVYVELADKDCATIQYIFETHRNEDYVIGSLELQEKTGAEICHSKETTFKYGEHNLSDGETFQIGKVKVKAIYTPGHTIDSMCYAVYDTWSSDEPLLVFTGDTLFIGDVGRTDLPGIDIWETMSEHLFDSLHEKVLPLGNQVLVYPGHTAGSICGSLISDREMSTLGYESLSNPQLKLDKAAFVKNRLDNVMLRPPYFRRMEDWNLNGAPLLQDHSKPKPLNLDQFEEESNKAESIILDAREPDAFAASHIPGSINIWLDGVSFFPGWTIGYDQQILLITERQEDIITAVNYLHRLGYDNVMGYLCHHIREWRNTGKPIETIGTLSAVELQKMLQKNGPSVLDVREEHEWNAGHIEGAERIYVGLLNEEMNIFPKEQPIVTICAWGGRGGLASSILKRKGFTKVYNLLGGMNAWKSLGYPLISET
jgi:hydroxyacylglutathione hydrolase